MPGFRRSPLALALLLATSVAHADELQLANGDRLSGSVVSLASGSVKFQTGFGATVDIPWEQVTQLRTDDSVVVQTDDGSRVSGRIAGIRGDRLRLDVGAAEPQELALNAVTAFNPPEELPPAPPKVEYSGRINAGATLTRGNTETDAVQADAEMTARGKANRFNLAGKLNYARDDTRDIANNASIFGGWDHFIDRHWYLNSNVGFARDEFKALDLRSTAGLGLGYQWSESDRRKLSAEFGLSYVHEDFANGETDSLPAARWALKYEHRLASATIYHDQELLLGIEDIDDTLLRTRTGLRMPISERVSGSLQINYDHDFQPVAGADEVDVAYLFKIGYEWK